MWLVITQFTNHIFIVLDKKSGTNNQHLVCQMVIAVFSKYMSQIGFVDSQILGREHFVNGTHAAKVIVLVICQEMYMYYLSSHILFLCKYTKYLVYGIFFKEYLCFFRFA